MPTLAVPQKLTRLPDRTALRTQSTRDEDPESSRDVDESRDVDQETRDKDPEESRDAKLAEILDYVDESAIEDDYDSSDWEDSARNSGDKTVSPRGDLKSRRSVIAFMLQGQNRSARKRYTTLPAATSSPNNSDDRRLMIKALTPLDKESRSAALPIRSTASTAFITNYAMWPRTIANLKQQPELWKSEKYWESTDYHSKGW